MPVLCIERRFKNISWKFHKNSMRVNVLNRFKWDFFGDVSYMLHPNGVYSHGVLAELTRITYILRMYILLLSAPVIPSQQVNIDPKLNSSKYRLSVGVLSCSEDTHCTSWRQVMKSVCSLYANS